MRTSQNGNAIVIILVAIALFAALAYTFMNGAKSGTGNLTSGQANLAAQELANYFSTVVRTAERLRQRGCSENDISFSSSRDGGSYVTKNGSPTAPPDKSCHVFDSAGGGITTVPDFKAYQVPFSTVGALWQEQVGQVSYRQTNVIAILDIGTADPEISVSFNFVKPEICEAYNRVVGANVDLTVAEPVASLPVTYGDDNPTVRGLRTFCHYAGANMMSGGPTTQIVYVWIEK